MKVRNFRLISIFATLCVLLSCWSAGAQSYVRYVKPSDFGTEKMYSDTILTSILLPKGVSKVSNYYKFNAAVYELYRVLEDPNMQLMQVWVCGSTSPDGLWGDNVKLSKARTDNAVEYIKGVMNIPDYMIHAESLNEDWDRLAELVEASELPFKYEVLYIIRTKDWGERKTALQKLDGGRVWRILEEYFFPQLRGVRFAIFCKWDPSKPYLTDPSKMVEEPVAEPEPVEEPAVVPVVEPEPEPEPLPEPPVKVDTVYVRDTVVYHKETIIVEKTPAPEVPQEDVYQEYRRASLQRNVRYWDTPWMMGLKTNLVADAIAIPMAGLEFQIGRRASLDLQGWYGWYNMFSKDDQNTLLYGFSPELRVWSRGKTMMKGAFFGLHANVAWYTFKWTDGYLYQNGNEGAYAENGGSKSPAWSAGLTCGYSLALDRKAHWGLEFVLGVGYGNYNQNLGKWDEKDQKWYLHEYQNNAHIGITKVGVNLTYRFSLRKVKPEFYENR